MHAPYTCWAEPPETLFEGKQTNQFKLVLTHYHIIDSVPASVGQKKSQEVAIGSLKSH